MKTKILIITFIILGCLFVAKLPANSQSTALPIIPINRRILLVIYNPTIATVSLTQAEGWNDPDTSNNPDSITNSIMSNINADSQYHFSYTVAQTIVRAEFPQKGDGYVYNQTSYLNCLADDTQCHMPDEANLLKIVNDSGACDKLNSGAIDELWLWGGPYFGFGESILTGPNAFQYNSSPLGGTSCNKLLPIMEYNYAMPIGNALHSYSHRIESTMTKVYGGWSENSASHNWNKYALVKFQSPNFSYSGCGSTHFPTNGVHDYDYSNTANVVDTTCDDFYKYPDLTGAKQLQTTCSLWNCNGDWWTSQPLYMNWLFKHLPVYSGVGPDGKLTNWWQYVANPNVIFTTPTSQVKLMVNNSLKSWTVNKAQPFSLNWSSEYSANCSAIGNWSGIKPASGYINVLLKVIGIYNYYLKCGNSVTDSVKVTVLVDPSRSCTTSADCVCGLNAAKQCDYLNRNYNKGVCYVPDFCTGISGKCKAGCVSGSCTLVCP